MQALEQAGKLKHYTPNHRPERPKAYTVNPKPQPQKSEAFWHSELFPAGKTTKWFWLGVGVSLSVSCTAADTFGCKFGISVGAIATGWSEKQTDEKCPFGPTLTGFKCKRSVGGTMLLFCCSYDLLTGENSCR